MEFSELVNTLVASLLAGCAILITALFAEVITSKLRRRIKSQDEGLTEIAEAIQGSVLEVTNGIEKPAQLTASVRQDSCGELISRQSSRKVKVSEFKSIIKSYHEQALSQASVQFWVSIMAAVAGFIWILYAGVAAADKLVSVAKILPGTVIDAVAFLFLRQASQTRQRATELYDKLRRDEELLESKLLVMSIENPQLRGAVIAAIALHMAGMESDSIGSLWRFVEDDRTAPLPAEPDRPLESGNSEATG